MKKSGFLSRVEAERKAALEVFPPCKLCDGVTMMSAKGRILLDLEKEVFLDYFDYCPCCGRPLTADAVMETVERFGALDVKKEEYAL